MPSLTAPKIPTAPSMALLEKEVLQRPPMPEAVSRWEVHKFGGASLANADLYIQCSELLRAESARSVASSGMYTPTMAIVSAKGGVTDKLIDVVKAARDDIELSRQKLERLVHEQLDVVRKITTPEAAAEVENRIKCDMEDILMVIRSVGDQPIATTQ